mmetsp:Transcript_888/g.1440  ORF Transcript_888/g.1440 Transcript_888/m.1440 type:complete len:235 (+) Transcript_888:336-1040(+)
MAAIWAMDGGGEGPELSNRPDDDNRSLRIRRVSALRFINSDALILGCGDSSPLGDSKGDALCRYNLPLAIADLDEGVGTLLGVNGNLLFPVVCGVDQVSFFGQGWNEYSVGGGLFSVSSTVAASPPSTLTTGDGGHSSLKRTSFLPSLSSSPTSSTLCSCCCSCFPKSFSISRHLFFQNSISSKLLVSHSSHSSFTACASFANSNASAASSSAALDRIFSMRNSSITCDDDCCC